MSPEVFASDPAANSLVIADPSLDASPSQCRQYSGTTVVIVDPHNNVADANGYAHLEVLFGNESDGGLVVLGVQSTDPDARRPIRERVTAYCRLAYELHSPIFNPPPDQSGSSTDGGARTSGETPLPRTFHIYYPIGEDGELVTTFSGRSLPRNDGLINRIEAVLERG